MALSGLQLRLPGLVYFLTVTAPGADMHCKRPRCPARGDGDGCPHKRCPCTGPGGTNIAKWNGSHGKRWNHLITRLNQAYGHLEYFRGCEVQDGKRSKSPGRMALHDHAIVRSSAVMVKAEVRAMAMAAGYGHSVDLELVAVGSSNEAKYVSKYVVKSADARDEVPWWGRKVSPLTGEIYEGHVARARYRTYSTSRSWGTSMRDIRAQCASYMREKQARAEVIAEAAKPTDATNANAGGQHDPAPEQRAPT